MNIFLDDCPHRTRIFQEKYPDAITTTKSKSIIALLKLPIDVLYLFLDHDLFGDKPYDPNGDIENTGMEVVAWLENNPRALYQVVVHSCNIYASIAMTERLKKAGYNVVSCPFWDLVSQLGK